MKWKSNNLLLFLSPWFMVRCTGHATSVDLDHMWGVLLTFEGVISVQIYSIYIHKRFPTISLHLCIACIAWEFFGHGFHECLYWEQAQCGPPSCVLAVQVNGPWGTVGPCGPYQEQPAIQPESASQQASLTLSAPSKPPISDSHVLWLNTSSWRLCPATIATIYASPPPR